MKFATWNVNSIKARREIVTRWLETERPEILMIQELKGLEFPADHFQSIGYHSAFVPQKAYNGVAILTRDDMPPPQILHRSLPADEGQARYLEVECAHNIRAINIYAPNGNPVESEKFPYKLRFLSALCDRLETLRREGVTMVLGGDFNIIPEDIDCHNPKSWEKDALFQPESRALFRRMKNLGLIDIYRALHPYAPRAYTYWDYFGGAWEGDRGIRIDHFLISPALADRTTSCHIDRTPRGWDTPSDHTPLVLEIAL